MNKKTFDQWNNKKQEINFAERLEKFPKEREIRYISS